MLYASSRSSHKKQPRSTGTLREQTILMQEMSTTPHYSHLSHEETILRRVMTTLHIEVITPPRMSQEAGEMKEKQKREAQNTS